MRDFSLVVVCLCMACSVFGDETAGTVASPATRPIEESVARYQSDKEAATIAYNQAIVDAEEKLAQAYRYELKAAMAAGNLEKANAANDAIKSAVHREEAAKQIIEKAIFVSNKQKRLARFNAAIGNRVVIILDQSGYMLIHSAGAKAEIGAIISRLRPDQQFQIIAFCDDRVLAFPVKGPSLATTEIKRKSYSWLGELVTEGVWTPGAAIEKAMTEKPDTIILVENIAATGRSEQFDFAEAFRKIQKKQAVRINVIATETNDDDDAAWRKMANDNGGECVTLPIATGN